MGVGSRMVNSGNSWIFAKNPGCLRVTGDITSNEKRGETERREREMKEI